MFKNEEEIEKIVNDFCLKNNCSKSIFEVSKIAREATGGKAERLSNGTKVKNEKCTYVIKYYFKLDLIVIWNYSINHSMNYSYKTIKEKLSNGIRYADKGTEIHTRKQYLIYFDKSKNFNELLRLIINPI